MAEGEEVDDPLYYDKLEIAETLYDPRNAIPRNLRKGIYRGGRRRIDIFWKIYTGIAGTPMPGLGPASPGGPRHDHRSRDVEHRGLRALAALRIAKPTAESSARESRPGLFSGLI